MRSFLILFLVAFLFSCNDSEDPKESALVKLSGLTRIYDSALIRNDTGTIKKMLADEYTFVNAEGQVLNKEQQLQNLLVSEIKWETGKSEDVQTTLLGNAAVSIGTFRGSGTYRGNPISINERFSLFWIKRDTSWLLASEHVSVIQ